MSLEGLPCSANGRQQGDASGSTSPFREYKVDFLPSLNANGDSQSEPLLPVSTAQRRGAPRQESPKYSLLQGSLQALSRRWSLEILDEESAKARSQRINAAQLADSDLWEIARPQHQGPLRRVVHVLEETFTIFKLAMILWSYLGLGWRWSLHLVQLMVYATLLMPGFAQMVVFYFFSRRVVRSLPYGSKPRNRLDLYLPPGHCRLTSRDPKPVVVFVTGGAWTIGYKAWGSLLGRRLSKSGCIVACLDYRNFPQGTVAEMLEDVNTGISWVLHRIEDYGGDPQRVTVVGQSCGAQLSSMAIILQAEQRMLGKQLPGGFPQWTPSVLRGFVGVSGLYNVHDIADYLHARGLYRSLFHKIQSLEGRTELKMLSPVYCVKDLSREFVNELPPVTLLHGSEDRCVPVKYAEQFRDALSSIGAEVQLKAYQGETHTSPLIENPLRGGRDQLEEDVLAVVMGRQVNESHRPMCPSFLIRMAATVNPF